MYWKPFCVLVVMILFVCGCRSLSRQCKVGQPFVFGIIADVQYADKDNIGARHYRTSLQKLKECVADFNDRRLSFVIQLGDFIDGGPKAEKELDQVLTVYNTLNTDRYHVLGNHDFTGISRSAVLDKMGIDRGYYDFTIGCWRFVVLDTMDIAVSGGWPQDSDNYRQGAEMLDQLTQAAAANAVDWNGGVSSEQIEWLDRVLTDADNKKQRAIIFGHHPVRPAGDIHNVWNADEIVKVLRSHDCPAAYLNGHTHQSRYTRENGIAYITLKAMVEAPLENAYALIECHPDKIRIIGFGDEPSRDLPL